MKTTFSRLFTLLAALILLCLVLMGVAFRAVLVGYLEDETRENLQSNGEALESGKFTGTISNFYNASGEIDVETIRDSTDLDENGVGRLLGLRVVNAA